MKLYLFLLSHPNILDQQIITSVSASGAAMKWKHGTEFRLFVASGDLSAKIFFMDRSSSEALSCILGIIMTTPLSLYKGLRRFRKVQEVPKIVQ